MPQYQVQPGDVLEISVWREPDLAREVLVRPDGHFTLPLIGEVDASLKSVDQIKAELTESISRYVPDADVHVAIRQLSGNKVYVIGNVTRPGEFMLVRPTDVMQVLSIAGGPTPFADLDDIIILRRGADGQTVIHFHYGDVESGKGLEQNVLLKSGDVVVVP